MRVAALLVVAVVAVVPGAVSRARAQAAVGYGMAAASSATVTSSVGTVNRQRLRVHGSTHRNAQGVSGGKVYRSGVVTATREAAHPAHGMVTVQSGHGEQQGRVVDGVSPASRRLGTSGSGLTVVGEEPRAAEDRQ